MDDIVGVRFADAGPISYCSPGALHLGVGDYVVVRTDRGERLGWVVIAPGQAMHVPEGPRRVIDRLASEDDVVAYRAQQERAEVDRARAQAIAARRDPRVRIASLIYDLAGQRGDLTFVSRENDEGEWLRREAGRQLGVDLHVEQVGDRDRAKALGGLGQCGRALCCASWQVEFPAISIKMAKDQGLAPNPSKISGVCGRLLCCLSFEIDAYREILGTLPKVGKRVTTPVGRAKVLSINALTEVVRLRFDETGEIVEIPAASLRQQYGTAVRPEDLEAAIEGPIHEQDQDRRDHFLALIEPVDRPGAPRRPRPASGEEERAEPAAWPAGSGRPRPAADRPAPGERRSRRPRPARSTEETAAPAPRAGRPGIAGRRSTRAAQPQAEATPRTAPRPARAPRPAGEAAEGAEGEQARRRRRRGRRGGRGRGEGGAGGGAGDGGAPATE